MKINGKDKLLLNYLRSRETKTLLHIFKMISKDEIVKIKIVLIFQIDVSKF